jgi:hypothetical protein
MLPGPVVPHILNLVIKRSLVSEFHTLPALPERKEPSVTIGHETRWTPGSTWMFSGRKMHLHLPGFESRSFLNTYRDEFTSAPMVN